MYQFTQSETPVTQPSLGLVPAKVSLSEYLGTSFLSVPTDDKTNELGREFYPFLTLRGKDAKGKGYWGR